MIRLPAGFQASLRMPSIILGPHSTSTIDLIAACRTVHSLSSHMRCNTATTLQRVVTRSRKTGQIHTATKDRAARARIPAALLYVAFRHLLSPCGLPAPSAVATSRRTNLSGSWLIAVSLHQARTVEGSKCQGQAARPYAGALGSTQEHVCVERRRPNSRCEDLLVPVFSAAGDHGGELPHGDLALRRGTALEPSPQDLCDIRREVFCHSFTLGVLSRVPGKVF